jgi:DNA-damage-inducible protein J
MTVDEETYLAWFRTSVREAQNDPRPAIPHAQVMEVAQMLIDEKRRSQAQ